MKAGFSTAGITPRDALPLAGYAGRTGCFTAVDAPLEANFAAFFDADGLPVVLGGLDALFVGEAVAEGIAREAGLPRERVILVSSHTHGAPSLVPGSPLLGRFDPAYGEEVVRAAGAAIRGLLAAPPSDVRAAYGEGAAPFNVNRRRPARMLDYGSLRRRRRPGLRHGIAMAPNPRGAVDPMLRCIVLREGGEPRAILWSYACHPAFHPFADRLSPDFPGAVRSRLRAVFGGDCAVIYLPGLAGSAIPRIPLRWRSARSLALSLLPFNPILPSFTAAGYRRWVDRVAEIAVSCVLAASGDGRDAKGVVHRTARSPVMFGGGKSPDIRLEAVRLDLAGSCGILALNGEPLGEWRPLLPAGMLDRRIATGYLAGPCLYVPTDAAVAQGGYEADQFRTAFGLEGGAFADGLDAIVTGTLEALFPRRSAMSGDGTAGDGHPSSHSD